MRNTQRKKKDTHTQNHEMKNNASIGYHHHFVRLFLCPTFVRVVRHDFHGTNDFPNTSFPGQRRRRLPQGVFLGVVGSFSFFFVEIIHDGRQFVKHGAGGGGEVIGQKRWQRQSVSGHMVCADVNWLRYTGSVPAPYERAAIVISCGGTIDIAWWGK